METTKIGSLFSALRPCLRTVERSSAGLLLSALIAGGCAASEVAPADEPARLSVTYLANAGFVLEVESTAVLIDALFAGGLSGYPVVPTAARRELEGARGRFQGVGCVLVTHAHADHFDPGAVRGFLSARPAQLFSTREVVEGVGPPDTYDGPEPRWFRPSRGTVEEADCGGARVSMLSLRHGRLMVRNLGFVVELGGFKVLHVGDTSVRIDDLSPYGLGELDLDVALLPAWLLSADSGRDLVAAIGARYIVAMHLPVADAPRSWFGTAGTLAGTVAEIEGRHPSAWIPVEPLTSREFSAAQ